MVALQVKSLGQPDRRTTFLDDSERVVVTLPGGSTIGHGTYEPGWRWSAHAQPLTGKDSQDHLGLVISGRMCVRARDGAEVVVGADDVFFAAAGSDAWVVGDEPCVALDFAASPPD